VKTGRNAPHQIFKPQPELLMHPHSHAAHGRDALLGQLALQVHLGFEELGVEVADLLGQDLDLLVVGGSTVELGFEFGLLGEGPLPLDRGRIVSSLNLLSGGLLFQGQAHRASSGVRAEILL
jgi:hypothetical protein